MDPIQLAAARIAAPPLGARDSVAPGEGKTSVPFSEHVKSALLEANRQLNEADAKAREIAEGKGDIIQTVTALARAELSLRHVVTLRNRALEAYQEIMRLQL